MSAHGTISRYNNYRCRCDDCRAAMNAYRRAYKIRRKQGAPIRPYRRLADRLAKPEHGLTRYRLHNCRCTVCVAANRQQLADVEAWKRWPKRAPIGPLLERAASVAGQDLRTMSHRDIGKVCGVDQAQISRWVTTGSLPFRNAEKIAIHLGWHPAGIWGVEWYLMEEAA